MIFWKKIKIQLRKGVGHIVKFKMMSLLTFSSLKIVKVQEPQALEVMAINHKNKSCRRTA